MILALTPDEFQNVGLAWVGAITAVITGAAIAAAVLLPKLAAIKAQIEGLIHSRDTQRQDIQANQAAITQLAIHTPVPTAIPAMPPRPPMPPAAPRPFADPQ